MPSEKSVKLLKGTMDSLLVELAKRHLDEKTEREQPRVEVYDPRYLEYLDGDRDEVPSEPEQPQRGVLIIQVG